MYPCGQVYQIPGKVIFSSSADIHRVCQLKTAERLFLFLKQDHPVLLPAKMKPGTNLVNTSGAHIKHKFSGAYRLFFVWLVFSIMSIAKAASALQSRLLGDIDQWTSTVMTWSHLQRELETRLDPVNLLKGSTREDIEQWRNIVLIEWLTIWSSYNRKEEKARWWLRWCLNRKNWRKC